MKYLYNQGADFTQSWKLLIIFNIYGPSNVKKAAIAVWGNRKLTKPHLERQTIQSSSSLKSKPLICSVMMYGCEPGQLSNMGKKGIT